jgi:hypothetical protein
MSKRSEREDPRPVRDEAPSRPQRPYRTPRLVTYGNLRELALAKGGTLGDGIGKPVSKA